MAATAIRADESRLGGVYKETAVGLTANLDLYGKSGSLLALEIDNTVAAPTYFKFYQDSQVDNAGLTAPLIAIAMPASTKRLIVISVSDGGVAFSPRLAMRASDAAMVSAGTDGSAPGTSCPVTVFMQGS